MKTIYDFIPLTENKKIDSHYIGYPQLDSYTHQEFAKVLNNENAKCYSIIIVSQMLDDKFGNDPKYMKVKNNIAVSEAVEEARRSLVNKYHTKEQIDELFKSYELELKADNYSEDEKVHREHVCKLEDGIFEMQQQKAMFEYLCQLKESCKYEYTDEGEDIELSKIEAETRFEIELEKVLMPRIYKTYERVYDLPYPLAHWDSRNVFQHYFFIENENSIRYIIGGSGGSLQRHQLGLYAHTFAELENTYNKLCPTNVYFYTKENKVENFAKFKSFRAFTTDLVGNYKPSSRDTLQSLFKNKLLNFSVNWENGAVTINTINEGRFAEVDI